jgi:hypothetical protein
MGQRTAIWVGAAKSVTRAALGRVAGPAWPAVEALSRASARLQRRGLSVTWTSRWTPALDAALELLPPLPGCPHLIYRELVRPTSVPKRHVLVCERGAPQAILSLRKRTRFWEPVTYQCLPFTIAPARDAGVLGRALGSLGAEVMVAGGIGKELAALQPSSFWTYDWHTIDLRGDPEVYWRSKKRQYTISRGRRCLERCEVRVDADGDLEWIVARWAEQWAKDPGCEVVATEDRLNLWPALMHHEDPNMIRVHTIMLVEKGERVGGLVFTVNQGIAMAQCGGRDPSRDDGYVAAAFTLALIDWSKARGLSSIDLAGGEYKRHWGPPGGQRHGVIFRPPLINLLRRVQP